MKSHRILTIASLASLVGAGAPMYGRAAIPDQTALKSTADTELTTVTAEVDQANILFSPVDDADGFNYAKVVQYHREYTAGRRAFEERKYGEALQHLRKAEEIIRSHPSWTDFQIAEQTAESTQ
jgi:hypothetical protein